MNNIRIARELIRIANFLYGKVDEKADVSRRRQKKVKGIRTIAENITSLRNQVSRDMKSDDEKLAITALAIALMDKTAERVGNDESAKNDHVGITGFKKKHIDVTGNKVTLKYVGKSGVDHEKSFTDEKIATKLKKLLKRCKNNEDFVFQDDDGYKLKAEKVNRYLDDFDVTAKDIRGYSANKIMVDKLKAAKKPSDEKERKKVFLEILRKVAKEVGHGAQTLRTHYLLPNLESSWIKKGKIVNLKTANMILI